MFGVVRGLFLLLSHNHSTKFTDALCVRFAIEFTCVCVAVSAKNRDHKKAEIRRRGERTKTRWRAIPGHVDGWLCARRRSINLMFNHDTAMIIKFSAILCSNELELVIANLDIRISCIP